MPKQQVKKFRKNGNQVKKPLHWLWGQQSVIETLQIGRWRVYELYVAAEVQGQNSDLIQSKQNDGMEVHVVPHSKLDDLTQKEDHQGIVARVSIYPCLPIEELATVMEGTAGHGANVLPILVAIDRIQDAFHFASILRCCKEAGVGGVIIGEYCQTQVTTQVARASLGAVNHFPVFQTADLAVALHKAKSLGYSVIACSEQAKTSLDDGSFKKPIALLVGSESHGVSPELLGICDEQVCVRMIGKSTALPAIVHSGIMLYEIRRQQSEANLGLQVTS